jgi:hypothetical protein
VGGLVTSTLYSVEPECVGFEPFLVIFSITPLLSPEEEIEYSVIRIF